MYKAWRGKTKVVSWPTFLRKGILKHKNLMNSDLETNKEDEMNAVLANSDPDHQSVNNK